METRSIWQRRFAHGALALGMAAIGCTLAGQAMAGCGQYGPLTTPPPADGREQRPEAGGFMTALYRPGTEPFMRMVDDRDRDSREAGIVGTWRFTFTSDGTAYPNPVPDKLDFGTVQWHSDGTEFMISGARPPSTGDVCMGSWEQTGPWTYKLKHVALAWTSGDSSTPAAFLGPSIIRETVTLNHARNAYVGTFTIDQYDSKEAVLLEHISGTVVGTRFSVD